jgi:hypothetical protein
MPTDETHAELMTVSWHYVSMYIYLRVEVIEGDDLVGPAAVANHRFLPLVMEALPQHQTRNRLTVIKIWSWTPDEFLPGPSSIP